ncbi:hypothetical protein MRX96_021157 [Rhipicephalus microplus]
MHPEERVHLCKQQRELQDEDDDSTDVRNLNVVQKYEDRHKKLARCASQTLSRITRTNPSSASTDASKCPG